MPTISISNTVASQALRGQNVKVKVDLTTQSSQFAQLQVGQICNNGLFDGLIYSIDTFGNSFEIIPIQPNLNFAAPDNDGYLSNGEDITITL
jgi:hypothetical protein